MSRHHGNRGRSDRKLATMIARQMAKVIPTMMVELSNTIANVASNNNTNGNNSGAHGENSNNQNGNNHTCTFKHFNSCKPTNFSGKEGATGLLEWFESMENTFIISECPDEFKVRYATSVLQQRALTWWNGEKRNRGTEVALVLPWEEFKDIMIQKFYPRSELQKLEEEFWNLKQDSGNHLAYSTRHHELSMLLPHMVDTVPRNIEKFIKGVPPQIQDAVLGSRPTTLEEAITITAQLTENHIRAGTMSAKGSKATAKVTPEATKEVRAESSFQNKKRKFTPTRNYAVTAPNAPQKQMVVTNQAPMARAYVGPYPMCNTCKYHHASNIPCRVCSLCGKYRHLVTTCLRAPNNTAMLTNRTCYNCGEPGHIRPQCPRNAGNVPPARGRAFNVNANQAQASNDVVNGNTQA